MRRVFLSPRRYLPLFALAILTSANFAPRAFAHGSMENGRMLLIRKAGPSGKLPAPWNDSYYTWNQNSQNFPAYANSGFQYSATMPNGTIASAGINDGAQTGLNFSGLNNPSASWPAAAATAGSPLLVHWLATATHNPSHFNVYLTRAGVNTNTATLAWSDLELLGSWAVGNTSRPVTTSTRPSPIDGASLPSYDWNVTIPADRSGHVIMLVIWQREDPAGEAFISVSDLQVAAAPVNTPTMAVSYAANSAASFDLRGTAGQVYDLQATDNLANPTWVTISSGTVDGTGHWLASDTNAAAYQRRFYRAVLRP